MIARNGDVSVFWGLVTIWIVCIVLSWDESHRRYMLGMGQLQMMTSSNGNIFRVIGPLCGEFTGPSEFPTKRPVTRSFDVFFDLSLNKRLSKQWWGWWFETQSCPLWRQCIGKEWWRFSILRPGDNLNSMYCPILRCVTEEVHVRYGSTSDQVMAWCHHATSHYRAKFMTPYDVTWPHWFNGLIDAWQNQVCVCVCVDALFLGWFRRLVTCGHTYIWTKSVLPNLKQIYSNHVHYL